ncbi:MAG: hypothetical protein REI64_13930 [Pedobacter sp.]|uniref:hypothetical protein n=1 Tax=Pedobacter sp. TaxID=1411316 RepID=UPI002806B9B2|nr:hypothetical protein [Pedobacter sp.]MDQ8005897.1 hypothetical protein [Pedobacter sp.]
MKIVGAITSAVLFLLVQITSAQEKGKFVNHGPQLTAAMIQGSIFVKDSKNNLLLYTVVRGEPAHLLAFNVASKALVLDVPLPKTDGAWDLAQSTDGTLYIPGAGGKLFSHLPGTKTIKDLGNALPSETYLWNLAAGNNGEVFGATYPGCRVFRYHPKDGFSDLFNAPLVDGENYVRSLAFDKKRNKLYAGVGSHAHLIEVDLIAKTKKEILPEKYQDREFVYGLELITGSDGVDRLLALLTAGNTTLVYNLKTQQVEQEVVGMDMKAVGTHLKNTIYTSKNSLMSFDAGKNISSSIQLATESGAAHAFFNDQKGSFYWLNAKGILSKYQFKSKKVERTKLTIPEQPIPINAIMVGPDQKVWTGGYLAGSHATFDPKTGKNKKYRGLDQTEGMTFLGDKIYFGIYPKGKFYVFDTTKPWNLSNKNPKEAFVEEGQSRSFAVHAIADKHQLYFGTVPEYGKLGGILIGYNEKTNQHQSYGEVLPKQSVVSLTSKGNILVVGGSISGGLGIRPERKEAELLIWDIESNKALLKLVPVAGAAAITSLINGPDGNIWGVADGQLFILDIHQQKVLTIHKLYDYPPFGSHIWRSAFMAIHPSGQIYGTDNGLLFKLDPITKVCTVIEKGAGLMSMDPSGKIYFKRGTELWSYTP